MMKCIRIGFGKIARIHEDQLIRHGVQTIGVVEVDSVKRKEIDEAGLRALSSIEDAVACKPDFYDVCTPTQGRMATLKAICSLDSQANILIEKPVCDVKDIQALKEIFKNHSGKIAINENYASSNVTKAVIDVMTTRRITPSQLIVESTKHRGIDFLSGRYINTEIGALGYEASHLLAIVGAFGKGYECAELLDSDIDNIHLLMSGDEQSYGDSAEPEPFEGQRKKSLSHQGGAFLQYRATNGCVVNLYSSLSGLIGFPCPPYAYPGDVIAQDDATSRYRILRVDGVDTGGTPHQIIGFYEPIAGLARSQAQLFIFKNWVLEHTSEPFEDNSMSQHLVRVMRHFKGLEQNPYDAERAFTDVSKLSEWAQTCWNQMNDSDDSLGRDDVAEKRLYESKKFKLTT